MGDHRAEWFGLNGLQPLIAAFTAWQQLTCRTLTSACAIEADHGRDGLFRLGDGAGPEACLGMGRARQSTPSQPEICCSPARFRAAIGHCLRPSPTDIALRSGTPRIPITERRLCPPRVSLIKPANAALRPDPAPLRGMSERAHGRRPAPGIGAEVCPLHRRAFPRSPEARRGQH